MIMPEVVVVLQEGSHAWLQSLFYVFVLFPLKLPDSLFWVWEQNSWQLIVVTHTCDANRGGGGKQGEILNLKLTRITW